MREVCFGTFAHENLKVTPRKHLLIIDKGMNADVIGGLLGTGAERPTATHADGWEVSTMLHF